MFACCLFVGLVCWCVICLRLLWLLVFDAAVVVGFSCVLLAVFWFVCMGMLFGGGLFCYWLLWCLFTLGFDCRLLALWFCFLGFVWLVGFGASFGGGGG